MNTKRVVIIGMTAILCAVPAAAALASGNGEAHTPRLADQVREATRDFRDVNNAIAAGYTSLGSCVSSPEEGAMGIHYARTELIGDGQLIVDQPELLVYEQRGHRLRLLGVEYLEPVDTWAGAGNPSPPVLVGQHFHFVNTPNRYGLPAFYELHVWAWKNNSKGMFVDYNPAVSCEDYTGEPAATDAGH